MAIDESSVSDVAERPSYDLTSLVPATRYSFSNSPDWVPAVLDEGLIAASAKNEKNEAVRTSGKGLCYIYRRIINASNDKNEDYSLRVWDLNSPEILQGASIMEFLVGDHQYMVIHRVAVIRDGAVIDKRNDFNIKVLDDEQASLSGSLNQIKKIHCVVQDLRLRDVFIFEYTRVSLFSTDHFLDKKYFRLFNVLPAGYWLYVKYEFTLIQNRKETIKLVKRYFRDEQGERLPEANTRFDQGEKFTFEQADLQLTTATDRFAAGFEFATDTTWEEISTYISSFYKSKLDVAGIKDLPQYKALGLQGRAETLEEDMRTVIEYVQNEIIYLFDAEVMHGHVPQDAEKTLTIKSGDCKAKSILLINLLTTLGVKAECVLVNYSYDPFLTECIPSPFSFNHVIVKIYHGGKEFFVDSTWTNNYGFLAQRAQPYFAHYLPIVENASLATKEERNDPGINIESNITIQLEGVAGSVKIESIYRRESADIVRNSFKNLTTEQVIKSENQRLYGELSYHDHRDISTVINDATCNIVSDNQKENVVTKLYQCKLMNPYEQIKEFNYFRFWYPLNIDKFKNYNHKDQLCDSFCTYPSRYTLDISSDRAMDEKGDLIQKSLKIDNDYFTYSNIRSVSSKSVKVISEYLPKKYDFIKKEDFENVKKDYLKIVDSNFGVGIKFIDPVPTTNP